MLPSNGQRSAALACVINYDLSLVGAAYQEIPLAISYFDWIPVLFRQPFDKRKGKWT